MKRFEKVQNMNAREQAKFFFDNWLEFYIQDGSPICNEGCNVYIGDDKHCYKCLEHWLNQEVE